jgi:hypothetical protein
VLWVVRSLAVDSFLESSVRKLRAKWFYHVGIVDIAESQIDAKGRQKKEELDQVILR